MFRYGTTNCTTVLDNMYTIEYKEECGRKYDKICYGPHNTDCKAVVDPACYQVPTLSPVQVKHCKTQTRCYLLCQSMSTTPFY